MKFKPLMLGICLTTSALSQLGMADELPLLGKSHSVHAGTLAIDQDYVVEFKGERTLLPLGMVQSEH